MDNMKTELGALFARAAELLSLHSDPTLGALGELLGEIANELENRAGQPPIKPPVVA